MQLHSMLEKAFFRIIAFLISPFLFISLTKASEDNSPYNYNSYYEAYTPNSLRREVLSEVMQKVEKILSVQDIQDKIPDSDDENPLSIYIPLTLPFESRAEFVVNAKASRYLRAGSKLSVVIKIRYSDEGNACSSPTLYRDRARLVWEVKLKKGEEKDLVEKIQEQLKQTITSLGDEEVLNSLEYNVVIANAHNAIGTDTQDRIADYKSSSSAASEERSIIHGEPIEQGMYNTLFSTMLSQEPANDTNFALTDSHLEMSKGGDGDKDVVRIVTSNPIGLIKGGNETLASNSKEAKKEIVSDMSHQIGYAHPGVPLIIPVINENRNKDFFANLKDITADELDRRMDGFNPYDYLVVEYQDAPFDTPYSYERELANPVKSYQIEGKKLDIYQVKVTKNSLLKDLKELVDALAKKGLEPNVTPHEAVHHPVYEDARVISVEPIPARLNQEKRNNRLQVNRKLNDALAYNLLRENIYTTLRKTFGSGQEVQGIKKETSKVIVPCIDQETKETIFLVIGIGDENNDTMAEPIKDGFEVQVTLPPGEIDGLRDFNDFSSLLNKYLPITAVTPTQQKKILDSYQKGELKNLPLTNYHWTKDDGHMNLLRARGQDHEYYIASSQLPVLIYVNQNNEDDTRKEVFKGIRTHFEAKKNSLVAVEYCFNKTVKIPVFAYLEEGGLDDDLDYRVHISNETAAHIESWALGTDRNALKEIHCTVKVRKGFLNASVADKNLHALFQELNNAITKEFNASSLTGDDASVNQISKNIAQKWNQLMKKGDTTFKLIKPEAEIKQQAYKYSEIIYLKNWATLMCAKVASEQNHGNFTKKILLPVYYKKENAEDIKLVVYTVELDVNALPFSPPSVNGDVITIPAASMDDNPDHFVNLIETALHNVRRRTIDNANWDLKGTLGIPAEFSYIQAESVILGQNSDTGGGAPQEEKLPFSHETMNNHNTTALHETKMENIKQVIEDRQTENQNEDNELPEEEHDIKGNPIYDVLNSTPYNKTVENAKTKTLQVIAGNQNIERKFPVADPVNPVNINAPTQEEQTKQREREQQIKARTKEIFNYAYKIDKDKRKAENKLIGYVNKIKMAELLNLDGILNDIKKGIDDVLGYRAPANALEKANLSGDLWNAVSIILKRKLDIYKNAHEEQIGNRGIIQFMKDVPKKLTGRLYPAKCYRNGKKLLCMIEKEWQNTRNHDLLVNVRAEDTIKAIIQSVSNQVDTNSKVPISYSEAFHACKDVQDDDDISMNKVYWAIDKQEQGNRSTAKSITGAPHGVWITTLVVTSLILLRVMYVTIMALVKKSKTKKSQPIEYGEEEDEELNMDDDEELDENEQV